MGSVIAILARSVPPDTALAQQMIAAAPHRGSNFTVRVNGSCVLGVSNKPDLIDATISSEGQLMAAFSGKLDNATDLTRTLVHAGCPPASADAADVVVAAFKAFGPDAPNRMRGVFASIVTDGSKVWCFRDHLGFRTLFYRDDPRAFFAATEAKQIIVGAGLRREPDLEVLERIFYGRTPEGMPCALKGVCRLPQATTLAADSRGANKPQRYWHPANLIETARLTPTEVNDKFSEFFGQAVARSLTGKDVIFLSGGIDSPTIAAFAAPLHRELTDQPISALSAVFPDLPSVDESRYIKLVSDYLGIKLHTSGMHARPLDDVKEWCQLLDGPCPTMSFSEIHKWYTLAHRLGFRNVLTGEFAEFLFTFHRHIFGHLLSHRRWSALLGLISAERKRGRSWRNIGRELIVPFVPGRIANLYFRSERINAFRRIPDWVELRKVNEKPPRPDLLPPARLRWVEMQLLPFKGSAITMEADELCAALSGVTTRRPFTDIDLWEFFLSLPAEIKFPDLGRKTLVRRLMRGKLPDAILDRRDKTYFSDYLMSHIDYPTLRRFLLNPNHRIDGVDYRCLAARIEREEFNLVDWFWANDLVRIHAFLSLW